LAQLNLLVGDVQGNAGRVRETARAARVAGADLVLFPELTLCGYPPEDLLFHRGLRIQVEQALGELASEVDDAASGLPAILVGYPEYEGSTGQPVIYNSARLLVPGRAPVNYRKVCLPNYRVFDEKRYFTAGESPVVVEFMGLRLGLTICEDVWVPEPARASKAAGAEVLLVLNASPYEQRKQREREAVLRARTADTGLPVAYVNLVGGQDELVFDGRSCALNGDGTVVLRAPAFDEAVVLLQAIAWPASPERWSRREHGWRRSRPLLQRRERNCALPVRRRWRPRICMVLSQPGRRHSREWRLIARGSTLSSRRSLHPRVRESSVFWPISSMHRETSPRRWSPSWGSISGH
jgi:predicted amidohydrolase